MDFLIDTGAAISILPAKFINGITVSPSAVALATANGQPISVIGESELEIAIPNLRRTFTWNFVIAETTHALLGIDFLNHFDISINCKKKFIVDNTTNVKLNVSSSLECNNGNLYKIPLSSLVTNLLEKYPELTNPKNIYFQPSEDVEVFHHIDTGSSHPVYAKARPLSTEKLEIAKTEFNKLLKNGIIAPSNSEWSSPLHMVKKPDGKSFRPCGDYRNLNSNTKFDRYPIPNMNMFSENLHGKSVFSKIDLVGAYHQIRVAPEDVPKTAVITPFGLFEFRYMPFGLKCAGATFQRYMDKIFSELKCVYVYLDDILIASENEQKHFEDLEKVFSLLKKYDLKINLKKCVFNLEKIDF